MASAVSEEESGSVARGNEDHGWGSRGVLRLDIQHYIIPIPRRTRWKKHEKVR